MEMQDIIKRYYNTAVKYQIDLENDFDRNMVNMISGNSEFNPETVRLWLIEYKCLRGINRAELNKIIEAINECLKKFIEPEGLERVDFIRENMALLLGNLYKKTERNCLVIASKILWCRFPNDFVIYDKFVCNTVTVLQRILPELSNSEILDYRPKIKNDNIIPTIDYYIRYQSLVHNIFTNMIPVLKELHTTHKKEYLYDIRIVDKILWIAGNPDSRINVAL